MKKYDEFSAKESEDTHALLLRDPDENMTLLAQKILGSNESKSLPVSFELVLIDKSPEQILCELLEYYCENSVMQYQFHLENTLKQKNIKKNPSKKVKKE